MKIDCKLEINNWKITNQKILIFLICMLFLFTRLYKIDRIPASLYWDEASIGYNAYSISQDAKDEWGSFLPLHFRAFGEFKLPVYIYSVVPFVKVFGLKALSVRLPSVFYSLAVAILIFLISKRLFEDETVALLSAFLFTIVPWMFIFSRTGYEASAGLFFYLLAIYLFIRFFIRFFGIDFIESTKKSFSLGRTTILYSIVVTIVFAVSTYSYNSFRIISPLTLAFLMLCLFFKQRKHCYKILFLGILSLAIIIISFIPIYRLYHLDAGASRLQVVSLQGSSKEKAVAFSKNYLSHFSYSFLFGNGDPNLRSQVPGFGQLYLVSLPFLLIGIFALIKKRNIALLLIFFVILISPIPASLTRESPHALRSIPLAAFYPILIALGITSFARIFRKQKSVVFLVTTLIFAFNFIYYFAHFISNYNRLASEDWQYGYKVLFDDKQDLIANAGKVIVSDRYAQPYIFALFYSKYSPPKFRSQVVYNSVDKWGFSTVFKFDKYVFKKVDRDDFKPGNLVVDVDWSKDCPEPINFLNDTQGLCIHD
jgi:4-amino-4-deoxy-L-arabinose transferase-like glycosyltransferase